MGFGWLATAAVCCALLLPVTASAQASTPPAAGGSRWDQTVRIADATFDVLFLRTSGLITTGVGALAFIPAAFVTSPGGMDSIREALDVMVLSPAKYTFKRPLGTS